MQVKVLKQFTKLINSYLHLDPESTQRLRKLHGKNLTVQLQPINWVVQCSFDAKGIHLRPDEQYPADAKLEGTPLQLLSVMMNKSNRQVAFLDDLSITGDAEVAQDAIHLFDTLEIDWEEHFSHFVGDTPAYYTNRFLRDLRGWVNSAGESFTQNLDEYIHEEMFLLPTRRNLEEFYQQIDTLRMDVDRMEARIKRLKDLYTDEESL